MQCRCAECLAQATDAELARMEAALEGLVLAKAEGDPEWTIDESDAEPAATVFQAYASEFARGAWRQKHGRPLSETELAAGLARAEYQMTRGFELLSDSARKRLRPFLAQARQALVDMAQGRTNPIQAGARMAEQFNQLEAQAGGATPEGTYSPYEFSRLARTEAAFADTEVRRAELDAAGADSSAVEAAGGWAPIHPQCMCVNDEREGADGKFYVVLDPSAAACDLCLEIAAQIEAAIP